VLYNFFKTSWCIICGTVAMNPLLENVRDFADKAHGDQTRKYSADRYIVHPVRVMELCQNHTNAQPVLAAALLHDVLEDTSVTKADLQRFLESVMKEDDAAQTLKLVVELTDVYTKDRYPRWNRRKRKITEAARIEKTSADSQTVKYADIIDNCREIVVQDPEFAGLFLFECKQLLKKIPHGDAALYNTAKETVLSGLRQVPRRFQMQKS
jgi:(p)ppGpp synthase/HD superfamily hydrolase